MVSICLLGICARRTVVAGVTEAIVIHVDLLRVRDRRTIVERADSGKPGIAIPIAV
jgi:hypothetical protein